MSLPVGVDGVCESFSSLSCHHPTNTPCYVLPKNSLITTIQESICPFVCLHFGPDDYVHDDDAEQDNANCYKYHVREQIPPPLLTLSMAADNLGLTHILAVK